jgi:hypothetical protein
MPKKIMRVLNILIAQTGNTTQYGYRSAVGYRSSGSTETSWFIRLMS